MVLCLSSETLQSNRPIKSSVCRRLFYDDEDEFDVENSKKIAKETRAVFQKRCNEILEMQLKKYNFDFVRCVPLDGRFIWNAIGSNKKVESPLKNIFQSYNNKLTSSPWKNYSYQSSCKPEKFAYPKFSNSNGKKLTNQHIDDYYTKYNNINITNIINSTSQYESNESMLSTGTDMISNCSPSFNNSITDSVLTIEHFSIMPETTNLSSRFFHCKTSDFGKKKSNKRKLKQASLPYFFQVKKTNTIASSLLLESKSMSHSNIHRINSSISSSPGTSFSSTASAFSSPSSKQTSSGLFDDSLFVETD